MAGLVLELPVAFQKEVASRPSRREALRFAILLVLVVVKAAPVAGLKLTVPVKLLLPFRRAMLAESCESARVPWRAEAVAAWMA